MSAVLALPMASAAAASAFWGVSVGLVFVVALYLFALGLTGARDGHELFASESNYRLSLKVIWRRRRARSTMQGPPSSIPNTFPRP